MFQRLDRIGVEVQKEEKSPGLRGNKS